MDSVEIAPVITMVMVRKRITDFHAWNNHRIHAGRISWIGPVLTLRDCQSCGGPKVPANAAVSDPCDAFVMARSGSRDAL